MFPAPTRKARIQMAMKRGLTQAQAIAEVARQDTASHKAAQRFAELLRDRGIKGERPGVFRFNPDDDNDPVTKAMVDAMNQTDSFK